MPLRPALAIALVSLWVVVRPGTSAALRGPSSDAFVLAAARYVADYEEKLTSVIADEIYTQEILAQAPKRPGMPRLRTLRSELFFMFEPLEREWMAIRDVLESDGKPIANRQDLRASLQTLPAAEVAATFKAANSRFNIGGILRNFNEPTLAMLVLDRIHQPRFKFETRRVDTKGDVSLATIEFVEQSRPTLITALGRPAYARGELLAETATGRIRRAVLTVKIGALLVELTTDYAPDAKLGMWVPSVFTERYEHGKESRRTQYRDLESLPSDVPDHELVRCEARYSNYRRFEVLSRIR